MSREILINPYKELDSSTHTQHHANFHQHSTESDGREFPSLIIDQAVDLGVGVFQISDHDSHRKDVGEYPKVIATNNPDDKYYDPERRHGFYKNTYPYSVYDEDVYFDPEEEKNFTELARVGTEGEFDLNDDAVAENGMVMLEGLEFSRTHHMIAIDTKADGWPKSDIESDNVYQASRDGGFVYFAHPGDFSDETRGRWYDPMYTPMWYSDMFKKHDNLLGLEVYNQGNRYTNDEKLWDKVNNSSFSSRPIWAFSGTDSHHEFSMRNRVMLFLKERTKKEVRNSLSTGNFYVSTAYKGQTPPDIEDIIVDEEIGTIEIKIDANDFHDEIIWFSGGNVIKRGAVINYKKAVGISGYLRARVMGKGGMSLINPFYFSRYVDEYDFV